MPETLPLFPLKTVLFPGGPLRLRIFEPRYIDLVRECTQNDTQFGVCLIVDGEETSAQTTATIGTTARITDFFTGDDGLLGIDAIGVDRFELSSTNIRDNGLAEGDLTRWEAEASIPLASEYSVLGTIAARLMEQVGDAFSAYADPQLEDATWVSCRLAELLPLELAQKQLLLECREPELRLDQLMKLLPTLQSDE